MTLQTKDFREIVDVRPLGDGVVQAETTTLLRTDHMEVVRLMMPAGKQIVSHTAPGEMTVQCLEGRVELSVKGQPHDLRAGQLLHLAPDTPHSVRGIEDGSLLLTMLIPARRKKYPVQEQALK